MSRSVNDLQTTTTNVTNDDDIDAASASSVSVGNSPATLLSTPIACSSATKIKMKDCPLCYVRQPAINFPKLTCCSHRSCRTCLIQVYLNLSASQYSIIFQYLQVEIMESRVMVTCPECSEYLHPTDIYTLMSAHPDVIDKYEIFSLRRVLMTDSDTRWCPAPDCGYDLICLFLNIRNFSYAVIASGCAACPEIQCARPGCGTQFCYHCKMVWHPNQTCDEARRERGALAQISIDSALRRECIYGNQVSFLLFVAGDIKACPRCRTYIVKMNDGSCNHMVCALCGAEFCWLCLKEISDLHYLR